MPDLELETFYEAFRRAGWRKSSGYDRMQFDTSFPKPITVCSIGRDGREHKKRMFVKQEVSAWISRQIEQSRATGATASRKPPVPRRKKQAEPTAPTGQEGTAPL